jgi:hypothetical protein
MEKIKDLQTLLENRAKEKIMKDIRKYLNDFKNNNLFKAIQNMQSPNATKKMSDWIHYEGQGYCFNEIFDALLPEYIETESKDFLSKVENIQGEIDELRDSIQ